MLISRRLSELTALLALTARASVEPAPMPPLPWPTHPQDQVRERFDDTSASRCLEAGRQALTLHAPTLLAMARALQRGRPLAGSGSRTQAPSALQPFDGPWRGRWGALSVRHLWHHVSPRVQLVVIEENGRLRDGVNLWSEGVLCGIVRGPFGERLHHGRAFAATERSPAYVKWMTPERIYFERVTHDEAGAAYEIAELLVSSGGLRAGVCTRYRRPLLDGVTFADTLEHENPVRSTGERP